LQEPKLFCGCRRVITIILKINLGEDYFNGKVDFMDGERFRSRVLAVSLWFVSTEGRVRDWVFPYLGVFP